MALLEQHLDAQREAAARRYAERTAERRSRIDLIQKPGGLLEADSEERVAKRLDRLRHYYAGERLPAPAEVPGDGRRFTPAEEGTMFEAIINTPDFVDIRYLEGGVAAARAVCRIDIRDGQRITGYGSGSLVSPRLVLTNHHVLPDPTVAAASQAEFNYQDGIDGQPLQPLLFPLDPSTFFLADEERDFALVAVGAGEDAMAPFGFNPLIAAEGKAIVGEFVTIVQHPRGQKKQVSLRENRIVDLVEAFLHYEADTEPGSSGSPVFNDQWEVVGLHHASVPAPEHEELGRFMNEGVRISRILRFLHDQSLDAPRRALIDGLTKSERINVPQPAQPAPPVQPQGEFKLTVPLEVSVRLATPATPAAQDEAVVIDPDYKARKGYDAAFLGGGAEVPLPTVADDPVAPVLPYHHYTVGMNRERRLAYYAAVNIDGKLGRRLKREQDRWVMDPRIPKEEQTGRAVYEGNDLDLGHLVRRLDPVWGTEAEAKLANDDTFHFTNCTPQHKDFNRNRTTWAGLEDYVLESAENRDLQVCVFTGPVFAADDDDFKGVKLPRQFWKVVAMVKESGELSATAYLLSQAALIEGLEAAPAEEFSYGAYSTFQVPVRQVEALTGLSFGKLAAADPLEAPGPEAFSGPREVDSPDQLVL